jgi:hypothetical protein
VTILFSRRCERAGHITHLGLQISDSEAICVERRTQCLVVVLPVFEIEIQTRQVFIGLRWQLALSPDFLYGLVHARAGTAISIRNAVDTVSRHGLVFPSPHRARIAHDRQAARLRSGGKVWTCCRQSARPVQAWITRDDLPIIVRVEFQRTAAAAAPCGVAL